MQSFLFTERVIGVCGLNGKGKTNLIDAVHYLSFTKSYFTNSEIMNVRFGEEGFRLEGELTLQNETDEKQKIVCIYRGGKKEFSLDGHIYEKLSHHVGKIPCVMIAPDDIEMITGSSEQRRKFLDTLISQADAEYLRQLILYNKVLIQRNSFLKNEAHKSTFNISLLEVLDSQLLSPAMYIYEARKRFTSQLFPLIHNFHKDISGNNESIMPHYTSQLNDKSFAELLKSEQKKDRILQRTTTGIHRDDLSFKLKENEFKSIASQGQRKSLLFACKLAEFEILKEIKGFPPILLMDDVFEKLDETRIGNLLEYVCKENTGQVFITDTQSERLNQALSKLGSYQLIHLK